MVIASLAPGEVSSISVDEENQSMEINVDPSQLAQIIGRNGQNIRLATQLSGWTLNLNKSTETNSISPKDALVESLGVDEEVAEILIRDGFETVQAVAAAGIAKLAETEEFDEEIAEAIYEQAKSSQLELTLTAENEESTRTYVLEGFSNLSRSQAQALARQDINTQDALAELAIDELRDIIDLSEETAGQIILAARAPWFNDTDNQEN
jgi:N utilization substance protein A